MLVPEKLKHTMPKVMEKSRVAFPFFFWIKNRILQNMCALQNTMAKTKVLKTTTSSRYIRKLLSTIEDLRNLGIIFP
jgi:hypothetical protein